jgi:hypothetical protein
MKYIKNNKYYLLIALTLVVIVAIKIIDAFIITDACSGIGAYELAKVFDKSQQMLNTWTANAKPWVAFDLGFDYLFILLYVSFIAISIYKIIQKLPATRHLLIIVGTILMYAQFIAGIFDGIENYLLLKILLGDQNTNTPNNAFWFASIKFAIVGLALLYIIVTATLYRKRIFGKK